MKTRVTVKGDRIVSQIMHYWLETPQELSRDERELIEELKESEFLAYAEEKGMLVTKLT